MKKDIHPDNYRDVIFHDISSGEKFLIGSTIVSSQTEKWEDGQEYPIVEVEISSASHPFYTGNEKIMDSGGRVDKFKKRMEKAEPVVEKPKTEQAPAKEEQEVVTEDAPEEVTEAPEEMIEDAVEESTEDTSEEVTSVEEEETEEKA